MILEWDQEDQSGAKVATNKTKNRVQATQIDADSIQVGSDLYPLGSESFFDGQRRSHSLTSSRLGDSFAQEKSNWLRYFQMGS
jgi:hypothetical protein